MKNMDKVFEHDLCGLSSTKEGTRTHTEFLCIIDGDVVASVPLTYIGRLDYK
jgi:hypothetical protein